MKIPLVQIYRQNRPFYILVRLARAFRRFRPEIVFAPQFGDLLQSGTAGRLCHAMVLGGLRSDGHYELNTSGRRSGWMLRLAHGLIANSFRATQNFKSRVARPPRMTILPNVLDLCEFDARGGERSSIPISEHRPIAVAVGSLQPSKRFDRFLRALALARRKTPSLLGIIAGDDCGSRADLQQQAKDLGLGADHLIFLGDCANVPALLVRAGFLVLCSEYEGFPNVILEAMAARLPVISTRVGDAEQIVFENQTGFLIDGDDTKALAERMVELASSPAMRSRLGREGRKHVELRYSYEILPSRLLAVFREFAIHHRRSQLVDRLQRWRAALEASPLQEPRLSTQPAG